MQGGNYASFSLQFETMVLNAQRLLKLIEFVEIKLARSRLQYFFFISIIISKELMP